MVFDADFIFLKCGSCKWNVRCEDWFDTMTFQIMNYHITNLPCPPGDAIPMKEERGV